MLGTSRSRRDTARAGTMILKLNHLHGKSAVVSAQDVIGTLYSLLEEGHIDQNQFARLQIELDWIQYRNNFREVVMTTSAYPTQDQHVSIMDVHIDSRQAVPGCLREELLRAIVRANLEVHDQEVDRV